MSLRDHLGASLRTLLMFLRGPPRGRCPHSSDAPSGPPWGMRPHSPDVSSGPLGHASALSCCLFGTTRACVCTLLMSLRDHLEACARALRNSNSLQCARRRELLKTCCGFTLRIFCHRATRLRLRPRVRRHRREASCDSCLPTTRVLMTWRGRRRTHERHDLRRHRPVPRD